MSIKCVGGREFEIWFYGYNLKCFVDDSSLRVPVGKKQKTYAFYRQLYEQREIS